MNRKDTQKNPLNKKIEENSESNSMNSLMEINITKNISQKEKEKVTESMNNLISKESEQIKSSEKSKSNIQEKKPKTSKRHRRGKSISDPRDFKCPECQRTYLSASALKNHRRMKHNFGIENEKKGRGRPKKEFFEEEYVNQMKKEYNKFLEEKKKKNEEKININIIKEVFEKLYKENKNELFGSIENIEKNTFYNLFKENWEKKETNLENKSYSSMMNCSPDLLIVNKPPIDCIFFQYIKYVSNIINKEYVVFILKFIIIFRQYINIEKKQSINIDYIDENKKEYTQLYDSSVIPDFFNDFLVDFMENRNYFFLDKNEIIKFIEYFCFWLFLEGYTDSHITKID
jgi:hypothetical protein